MAIAKSDVVSRLSLREQRKHPDPTYLCLLQTAGTLPHLVESFGGRLRDELLAVETFNTCWRPRCWWRS
jgi:hypothetical protein